MAVRLPISETMNRNQPWAIKQIQKKVGAKVDGIFGPETTKKVKLYQGRNKLRPDGIVGKLTWSKMFPIRSVVRPPINTKPRICLDIGHYHAGVAGGQGATAAGMIEHQEAHRYVMDLARKLKANGYPVLVLENVPLTQRDDKAAAWKAERFYVIHINAGGGRGTEVLVNIPTSAKVTRLANEWKGVALALGIPWRGLKNGNWLAVLQGRRPVQMLVELFFIDSVTDRVAWRNNYTAAVNAGYRAATKL